MLDKVKNGPLKFFVFFANIILVVVGILAIKNKEQIGSVSFDTSDAVADYPSISKIMQDTASSQNQTPKSPTTSSRSNSNSNYNSNRPISYSPSNSSAPAAPAPKSVSVPAPTPVSVPVPAPPTPKYRPVRTRSS